MKVIYFDNLDYGTHADLVFCNDCEMDDKADAMLVPCGFETCPLCGTSGCETWVQPDSGEHTDYCGDAEVCLDEFVPKHEIIHSVAYCTEDSEDEDVPEPVSEDMRGVLSRICKAIIADRFKDDNYYGGGTYYGYHIQTQTLHCSYGTIGYSVFVFDDDDRHRHTIKWDWEMEELTIDEVERTERLGLKKEDRA